MSSSQVFENFARGIMGKFSNFGKKSKKSIKSSFCQFWQGVTWSSFKKFKIDLSQVFVKFSNFGMVIDLGKFS